MINSSDSTPLGGIVNGMLNGGLAGGFIASERAGLSAGAMPPPGIFSVHPTY
jgi:hypothetical protein